MSAARRSDFVLLGEDHTNPTHHANQLVILRHLAQQGQHKALFFEMLSPDFNPILDQYSRAGMTSDRLKEALRWDARGWPLWESYFPLFEEARTHHMTIQGANISSKLLPYVTLYGGRAFPRKQHNDIGLGQEATLLGDQRLMATLVRQSHNVDENLVPALVATQYARDAHMATEMMRTSWTV